MIYRKANGDLIIIDKLNFTNDKIFYAKMMDLAKEYQERGNNIHINFPKPPKNGNQDANSFIPISFDL